MIFGEYPCCGQFLHLYVGDGPSGHYNREECPHCGATVWHFISRINPESWTEADFLAEFDVDEQNRRITRKDKPRVVEISAGDVEFDGLLIGQTKTHLDYDFKETMDYINREIMKALCWGWEPPPTPAQKFIQQFEAQEREKVRWHLQGLSSIGFRSPSQSHIDLMIIDDPERVVRAWDFASKTPFDAKNLLSVDGYLRMKPLKPTAPLTPPEPWCPPVARRNRRKKRGKR